ncbi:metallophosphoesterase [Candidatus Woesearchaeota archaeon]|nr:metallophosphoesterase [Candidatus Woesearchaeota archaeon]
MPYKILYTADLHGNNEYYKKLIAKAKEPEIKAVIIGGDLCPKGAGTLEQAINYQKEFLKNFFIPELSKIKKDTFIIMGNDDFRINETILKSNKNENIKYINKKRFNVFNKNIVGYGFVNPTPFRLKDWEKFEDENKETPKQLHDYEIRTIEKEEGTIKEDLFNFIKLSNPKKTIYAMHAPPYNTKLDIITSGIHVGSKAIREFIKREQPYLTLHGHIHESPQMSGSFIDKIRSTICINIGSSYPESRLNSIIIDIENLDFKYIEL